MCSKKWTRMEMADSANKNFLITFPKKWEKKKPEKKLKEYLVKSILIIVGLLSTQNSLKPAWTGKQEIIKTTSKELLICLIKMEVELLLLMNSRRFLPEEVCLMRDFGLKLLRMLTKMEMESSTFKNLR